jgi:5-(carboxyamino)imidazole ribonucleotide synthase
MPAARARRPAWPKLPKTGRNVTTQPTPQPAPVPPGGTIGILGSGQLGRMLAQAAARLGLRCHIYADSPGPAFDVAAETTIAAYDDHAALAAFAKSIAVATYEFENIPVETVEFLSQLIPVRPGAKALACTQDRMAEKQLARQLGAQTAEFAAVNTYAELLTAITQVGTPAILKTRRFGYDGKGQAKILSLVDVKAAWAAMQERPAILEGFVPFQSEVSVVAVRGVDGTFAAYDVTQNVHRDHMLHTSTVPAQLKPGAAKQAIDIAHRMAEHLDYVGTFAVEFFALDFAKQELLFVNEMAPRVHNSGHWTMDACPVSQFENHMRAVAGWPLGSTQRHSNAVMTNLIGAEHNAWATLAAEPGACLHLYGKHDARPGRKMGHVNRLTTKK